MKERLTGAIILVALLVLLVPELLTGPSAKSSAKPEGPEGTPLRTYTIDLADDTARPPQATTAPTSEAVEEPVVQATPEDEVDAPGADAPGSDASAVDAPGQQDAIPVDETAAASRPEPPRGSGADLSVAGPKPAAGTAETAEPERPRSAFGPNAVTRAQPEASKAAASGTAASRVASTAPARQSGSSAPRASASDASPSKGWAVQLGVFASRDNAERLAKQVKGKGYPVVVNETSGSGKRLFRVRVGPEAERADAVALGAKLRAAGHAGSVVSYP